LVGQPILNVEQAARIDRAIALLVHRYLLYSKWTQAAWQNRHYDGICREFWQ